MTSRSGSAPAWTPHSPPGWRPSPASAPRSPTSRCPPGSAAATAVAHGWSSAALTPYVLSAGRAPAGPGEVVTGYRARLGARLRLASTDAARTVTVVGVARPRHAVGQQTAIFLTDDEAARLAGHPGRADAIGVLAGPGFDASRLRAASRGAWSTPATPAAGPSIPSSSRRRRR